MYSRNKLRKEQQLLNLRQLSSQSVRADNDHKEQTRDKHSSQSSQSSPLQSSPNSMANRSPNQSSLLTSNASPIQSSKASIGSRGLCRTPRRDVSSGNESVYTSQQVLQSKTETNPNMSLRSVNRSPTVRLQTLRSDRSVGLQSRPTHSPNSRSNASLPQTLVSQSSTNCQNKQSLAKISDNSVKQRANDSVIDNQSKQKSLSSSTLTSTTITKPEPNISPEILFLVKEQAKAIAAINLLQKKVDRLEQTIKEQDIGHVNDEMSNVSSTSTTKLVNNNSKERIAISDDSGGEYSRATTTSDEDELSLLLDQIARRSQQLQSNTQMSNRFTNMSITSSSISGNNNNELLPQTMQIRPKWHTYVNPTVQMSHSTRSPTRETTIEQKMFGNYGKNGALMASQASSPSASAPQPSTHPSVGPPHSSISALLFEPNVENVLKNLDDIIANEPLDSNKFSNSSTISQTYQRSQTSLHSSHSLFDAMGVRAAGVSSGSLLPQNNSNTSSPTNWVHLERAKSFVKQREEREVDQQMRLNEEWLQTQLRAQEPNQHNPHNPLNHGFRRNNFIDSLEPTFR